MHQRIAGCVASIVVVLGWEALSATHAAPSLQRAVRSSDDPAVVLADGVLGARRVGDAEDEAAWQVEATLFVPESDGGVATCEVIATCSAGHQQERRVDDAGVPSVRSAAVPCQRPRRG